MIDSTPPSPNRKLTGAEWAEIRKLYEFGEASASELSERYGVSPSALSQHFKKFNVKPASRVEEIEKAIEKGVKAAHVAAVVNFESQRIQRIERTREDTYVYLENLAKYTMLLLNDARKGGGSPANTFADLKALRLASAIIEQTRIGRLDVLQANRIIDEEQLPQLVIDDLTEKDIKEHHRRNASADSDDELLLLSDEDADADDIISEGDDV